jgi:hypothetical protein
MGYAHVSETNESFIAASRRSLQNSLSNWGVFRLARKFYRRVSRPPSGGPYEVEGTFLSGANEAENQHDWITHVRARLALRYTGKPATKAGQIKALWPEIKAAIERGQSIKSIHKWLEEDAGLRLGVSARFPVGRAGPSGTSAPTERSRFR